MQSVAAGAAAADGGSNKLSFRIILASSARLRITSSHITTCPCHVLGTERGREGKQQEHRARGTVCGLWYIMLGAHWLPPADIQGRVAHWLPRCSGMVRHQYTHTHTYRQAHTHTVTHTHKHGPTKSALPHQAPGQKQSPTPTHPCLLTPPKQPTLSPCSSSTTGHGNHSSISINHTVAQE